MYSSRATAAIRVLRLRVKDKHAPWLAGLAREVNTVFNYCNELSAKVFERERRFLSGYRTGPQGLGGLGIRGWQCGVCGAIHDRDVNAAQNILAAGHRRLAEEILASQGPGGCQKRPRELGMLPKNSSPCGTP
jgi:Putative transposase DNA-binding domain